MGDDSYPRLPRRNKTDDDPKMIGLWKVGRTIGKGSSGRVRIARHSKTGQYAAVKIVSKNVLLNSVDKLGDSAEHILLSIEREIVIMKLIDHPNIMRLYDVWETSSELYLILEYVEGGELFDYLCNKGRLSTSEALGYFQQIISAIDYCHRFNIAHRDLKPENLLLDQNKNIKVADFGMAAWQADTNNGMLHTACGSPHYAAPEVIMGKEYNGSASDIWSCGVILFALLAGRLPFDDEDLSALLEKVKAGKYIMPSGVDPLAKDLITKMLEMDVAKRITIPQILKHPFFRSQEPKTMDYPMPNLDDIARPLSKLNEIDHDILANLRTLWHGTSEKEIIESLTSKKANWQKGVYHLLVQYRLKHLENYDEEEEEMSRSRRRKKAQISASAAPESPPLGIRKTSSQLSNLGSSLPPRADPPTPRRARRQDAHGNIEKNGFLRPDAPQITFQSPSPPHLGHMAHQKPAPSSLSPDLPLSPISNSSNLPPLSIPDLKDDKVQQFFQHIVEHLNAMEARTMSAPGQSYADVGSTLRLSGASNISAPPPTPVDSDFTRQQRRPHGNIGHRIDHYSSSSLASNEEEFSAADSFGGSTSDDDFAIIPKRSHREYYANADKENNGHHDVSGPGIIKKSSIRRHEERSKRPALRVQIVEPSGAKLRKKRSMETYSVSPAFSDSSFTMAGTPRRRWFGNVFKFKPTNYHLLSILDAYSTREECRRLLVGLGVRVVLTNAEDHGILKCKLDECRDPTGTVDILKSVRFRVEMRHPLPPQAIAGYQVALYFVQERGSSMSLLNLYNRLRRLWDLDAPRTPLPVQSPTLTDGGRYREMIYPN